MAIVCFHSLDTSLQGFRCVKVGVPEAVDQAAEVVWLQHHNQLVQVSSGTVFESIRRTAEEVGAMLRRAEVRGYTISLVAVVILHWSFRPCQAL